MCLCGGWAARTSTGAIIHLVKTDGDLALHMRWQQWLLDSNTSDVTWCEDTYTHSDTIAEWYNTWSNIAFLMGAWWMSVHFRNTPPLFGPVAVGAMVLQGLTSAWFHASKSLAGQMADELCIVFITGLSLGLFVGKLARAALASTLYALILLLWPRWNHMLLSLTVPPLVVCTDLAIGWMGSHHAWKVWRRSTSWVAFSFLVWSLDIFVCRPWNTQMHFHAMWHMSISITVLHIMAAGCAVYDRRCAVLYRWGGLLPITCTRKKVL